MKKLLLDGSKIEAEEFYEYRDDKFAMGGTAYSEPKLYSLTDID